MSTKYEWTDWVTHVPGQELLPGTYGLFEFVGAEPERAGCMPNVPYSIEGVITSAMRHHPVWRMTDNDGTHCRLIRYKLRIEREEQEAPNEVAVPVKQMESA